MTLRLLAEVAWQPIGIAVSYGVWKQLERERTGRVVQALGTAIAFVALVCVARVALGVHYPSDVASGLLFGRAIARLWPRGRS